MNCLFKPFLCPSSWYSLKEGTLCGDTTPVIQRFSDQMMWSRHALFSESLFFSMLINFSQTPNPHQKLGLCPQYLSICSSNPSFILLLSNKNNNDFSTKQTKKNVQACSRNLDSNVEIKPYWHEARHKSGRKLWSLCVEPVNCTQLILWRLRLVSMIIRAVHEILALYIYTSCCAIERMNNCVLI